MWSAFAALYTSDGKSSDEKFSSQLSSFFFSLFPHRLQKHKRKNHCDKNNDSTGNLADLSSNEDDVNIINGDFEKLQVAKPYQVKYSDIYGRFGIFRRFFTARPFQVSIVKLPRYF